MQIFLFALMLASSGLVRAQSDEVAPTAFRVCHDPNNLPFSNSRGEGFENKIAELFATKLNLPLEYYAFPQRINFVRNTLRYRIPNQSGYPCDVIIAVPHQWDQVDTTGAYFRSTYALAYVRGRKLDSVHDKAEFLALPQDVRKTLRIGVYNASPASRWLALHDLTEQGVPYRILNADPEHFPGEIIERDLVAGTIDAAIVWGPIAGYFAKRIREHAISVVPLESEPGVVFDYPIAVGLRRGEPTWKATLQAVLDAEIGAIHEILRDYGVPLVSEGGRRLP